MPTIHALRVKQWLKEWNEFKFDADNYTAKPLEHFYIFSMKASALRALTGVNRREATIGKHHNNTGIQRRHDDIRSEEIKDFLKYGYPYSDLSKLKRTDPQAKNLRKPGWLPTSIIVNILGSQDIREGKQKVAKTDLITVKDKDQNLAEIIIPFKGKVDTWKCSNLPPLEVIDGQHRLWAFDADQSDESLDYELPVVAFYNLDISWQAYLFWVINVNPKRINQSLAYDLYPLLRSQEWLQTSSNIHVYRETRAQEIVTALWALEISPWHDNINMLGEGGRDRGISQSSWIKSLTTSGSLLGKDGAFETSKNSWNASTQVAIICYFGIQLRNYIKSSKPDWLPKLEEVVEEKTKNYDEDKKPDISKVAFNTQYSFIGTDQGMRPLLLILNKYILKALETAVWIPTKEGEATNASAVELTIQEIDKSSIGKLLKDLAKQLAVFDWRTAAVTDKETERAAYDMKMSFRGAAGYTQLKDKLEVHLGKKS